VARTPCKESSGDGSQPTDPRAENGWNVRRTELEQPYFGDVMGTRDTHHIRVGNINLNNTLQNPEGDKRLFRDIYSRDINILCMQEVSCNWTNIHRSQTLQQQLNNTFGPQEKKQTVDTTSTISVDSKTNGGEQD
jgi:hypothetical protein